MIESAVQKVSREDDNVKTHLHLRDANAFDRGAQDMIRVQCGINIYVNSETYKCVEMRKNLSEISKEFDTFIRGVGMKVSTCYFTL